MALLDHEPVTAVAYTTHSAVHWLTHACEGDSPRCPGVQGVELQRSYMPEALDVHFDQVKDNIIRAAAFCVAHQLPASSSPPQTQMPVAMPAQPVEPCYLPPYLAPCAQMYILQQQANNLAGCTALARPACARPAANPDGVETYVPKSLRLDVQRELREKKAHRAMAKEKLRVKRGSFKVTNKVRYPYRQASAQGRVRRNGRFLSKADAAGAAMAPAQA